MTTDRYRKLRSWFALHPKTTHAVVLLDRWLPLVPFVCYPVLLFRINLQLFRSFLNADIALSAALELMSPTAQAILVPGFAFLFCTILRDRLDRPRPYQQPGFQPLVPKDTLGKSCPSRHALSATVLAMVWLYFYPAVGVFMLLIAALICLLRVLTGVHHGRDVLFGAAIGILFGYVGMWLL